MARTCFGALLSDGAESFHFDDRVCQNIDVGLRDREISASMTTRHFQENLMANLWSNDQLKERCLFLRKLG
jgi:hypothetical protein